MTSLIPGDGLMMSARRGGNKQMMHAEGGAANKDHQASTTFFGAVLPLAMRLGAMSFGHQKTGQMLADQPS